MTTPERWLRLSSLLDECLDLDPAARSVRLEALRREEPDVAAELERLLAADSEDVGALDGSLAEHLPTLLDRLADPPEPATAGSPQSRIGPFRLLRLLGRGGMGEVWLADRADSDFEQQVALKLLKRGMDSLEILGRFERERRILAALEHPFIARFVDGGLSDSGLPWFAMEYVEGETITDYARSHRLDLRLRVEMMARVCEAVSYAQSRLIVHRDLKPSNILIDHEGRPRLLDFGIAKLLQEGGLDEQTRTQMRALSPAYAAPEQVLDQPVGMPTDVYALGVVLYQLVTGRLPQRRDATSVEALSQQITQQEILRPSSALVDHPAAGEALGLQQAEVGRQARQLAGDLDVVILNALRSDPARRYVSAAAMADDLHAWLERRPVRARPDSIGYRTRRFVQRHAAGVVASAAVLLALLMGLGVALWQADEARREAARADQEAARATQQALFAEDQAQRAKRATGFLVSVFQQADPLRGDGRGPISLDEAFEDALARVDRELDDDPALKADLLDDFGEILVTKGRFDEARRVLERALELAVATHGEQHPAVAETLLNLAAVENYRGNLIAGKPHVLRAMPILEAFAERDPLNLANGRVTLAAIANAEGRLEEALALTLQARDTVRERFPDGEIRVAHIDLNIGAILQNLGRHREATPYLLEAEAITEKLTGGRTAFMIPVLSILGSNAYHLGEEAREADMIERRLAKVAEFYPGDHPWHAEALVDAGALRERRGEEGLTLLEAGAEMYERLGSPYQARALSEWAEALLARHDAAQAHTLLVRAAEICSAWGEARVWQCLIAAISEARALLALGQQEAALGRAESVAAALAALIGEQSSHYARAVETRARALAALGRREEAAADLRAALAIYETQYSSDHRTVAAAREALAEVTAQTPH